MHSIDYFISSYKNGFEDKENKIHVTRSKDIN